MATVAFVAPGLATSTHRCVHAMVRRAGHEPVHDRPDLVIATWFDQSPPPTGHEPHDGEKGTVPWKRGGQSPSPTVVRWWVGSDVLALQAGRTRPHSADERLNWAGSGLLVRELRALGVGARELPIVPHWEPEALPRAREPVVLLYCPQGREKLYRWKHLVAVAGRCPHVRFKVFRRTGPSPLPNLACVPGFAGREEMLEAYREARAVLRLVEHDGMSLSILEALGFGRHAVWTYPYPACHQAHTVGEAVAAVRRAVEADVNTAGVAAMETLRRAADAKLARYVEEALRCTLPSR